MSDARDVRAGSEAWPDIAHDAVQRSAVPVVGTCERQPNACADHRDRSRRRCGQH